MFPNFLGFILLVCHKAHLDWPTTVEKPSVAICFVKNRIIPVLLLQYSCRTVNRYGLSGAALLFSCFRWRRATIAIKHNNRLAPVVLHYVVEICLAYLLVCGSSWSSSTWRRWPPSSRHLQCCGNLAWTSTLDLRSVPSALFVSYELLPCQRGMVDA